MDHSDSLQASNGITLPVPLFETYLICTESQKRTIVNLARIQTKTIHKFQ